MSAKYPFVPFVVAVRIVRSACILNPHPRQAIALHAQLPVGFRGPIRTLMCCEANCVWWQHRVISRMVGRVEVRHFIVHANPVDPVDFWMVLNPSLTRNCWGLSCTLGCPRATYVSTDTVTLAFLVSCTFEAA